MTKEEKVLQSRAYSKAYQKAHPEEKRAKDKRYRAKHKKELAARHKRWRATENGRERIRAIEMRHKYGLTMEAFEAIIAGQGGVCAICGSSEWGHLGPVVDHNHETGDIRGVLCFGCNAALGLVHDNPNTTRGMTAYLERK